MGRRTISQETRQKAIELYLNGAKTQAILDELGIARASLYFILKDAGLRPSRVAADLPDTVEALQAENDRLRADLDAANKRIDKLVSMVDRLSK